MDQIADGSGFRLFKVTPPAPIFARPARTDETDSTSATFAPGAKPGDYLILYPDGTRAVSDGATFESHYEPNDPNDGWTPWTPPAIDTSTAAVGTTETNDSNAAGAAPSPADGVVGAIAPAAGQSFKRTPGIVSARVCVFEDTNAASPTYVAGANEGDYFVVFPDGSAEVVPAHIFALEYEPA